MRYIDSGNRDPSQALGTWLQQVLNDEVEELRWQSGFFTASALGFFAPVFSRLAAQDGKAVLLVGSNEGNTLRHDIEELMILVGVPRPSAQLGVISYSTSYFHPKSLHLLRSDGSEAAYVGSANLTRSGITAHHIEAGIILESRDGDPRDVLAGIAGAVDSWLVPGATGIEFVEGSDDVERLVAEGVLRESPPPLAAGATIGSGGGGRGQAGRPSLHQLIKVPALPRGLGVVRGLKAGGGVGEDRAGGRDRAARIRLEPTDRAETLVGPPAPRSGYPDYLLFSHGAAAPTVGRGALSGASLPSGAAGLIVKLNRDSARHFSRRKGTSNVSVPVPTLGSIQFGIFPGKYERPRAEFAFEARYIAGTRIVVGPSSSTNIMAYGFEPGETGHGDVRLVVPAAVKTLHELILEKRNAAPKEGDLALLEWPSSLDPVFKMSFIDPGSELHRDARALYDKAGRDGTRVGDGACWLPAGLSPPW